MDHRVIRQSPAGRAAGEEAQGARPPLPKGARGAVGVEGTRPARAADQEQVAHWLVELCAGDVAAAGRAAASALRRGAGREAWIIEAAAPDGPLPAGFLALAPSTLAQARLGYIDWLVVDPARRRQGLGAALVQLAQRRARALGWRQLRVSTFHDNRAALRLYIGHGFYPDAVLHDYIGPGRHYVELLWEPAADDQY